MNVYANFKRKKKGNFDRFKAIICRVTTTLCLKYIPEDKQSNLNLFCSQAERIYSGI